MITPVTLCMSCANVGDLGDDGVLTCSAFPDGIPREVQIGGFDHRGQYPGDMGVRYVMDREDPLSVKRLEQYDREHSGDV